MISNDYLNNTIYIFSVFNSQSTDITNEMNNRSVIALLTDYQVPFKELLCSYKGVQEKTILVKGDTHKSLVMELLELYNKESYLVLLPFTRQAVLTYVKTNESIPLGDFKPTTKEHALSLDNWTYDIESGLYYVTGGN
jgi:hypothetical protein